MSGEIEMATGDGEVITIDSVNSTGNGRSGGNTTSERSVRPFPKGMTTRVPGPIPRHDQREQHHTKAAIGKLGKQVQERWTSESVDPLRRILFPDTRPQNAPIRSWVAIADGPVNPVQAPVKDPAMMSAHIKEIAQYFGADLVGVCELRPEFTYSHRGLRIDHRHGRWGEPVDLNHRFAVSIGWQMDYGRMRFSPSFVDGAEVGKGYFQAGATAVMVASYIRELGYPAKAHFLMDEQVLHVPIAVAAGLGELGRIGILVTGRYGPRVRLSTVTTDLPLAADAPVDLGVQTFCEICEKCAQWCSSQGLPRGPKQIDRGYEHWVLDKDKCMTYWTQNRGMWNDCARCITVCPWNKPDVWWHRLAGRLVGSAVGRRLLLWLDDQLYPGRKLVNPKGGWLHYTRQTSAKPSPTGQISPPV